MTTNIAVNIHTEDGKTRSVDAPPDLKVADFTREILEGLRITSPDRQDLWELYDKSTSVALEPSRTLRENGVRAGQDLYLRLRQYTGVTCRNCDTQNPSGVSFCFRCGKQLAAATAPSEIKVHVHTPEGRIHLAEIPPSLRTGEFASDLVRSLGLASGGPDGTEFRWILEDSETRRALDPDRTLAENAVRSGHHLKLVQPVRPGEDIHVNGDVRPRPKLRIGIVLGILAILGAAIYFALRPKAPVVTVKPTAAVLPARASATAASTLEPGSKSLTVTPQQSSLLAGQRVQFHAQGEGGGVDVQWSLDPALGNISSDGWYQAPFPVLREQTVRVKATSKADAKQFAIATVTLTPQSKPASAAKPLSLVVAPNDASLSSGQRMQFHARVSGAAAAIQWAISPPLGTVSATGLYSAPASIPISGTVKITATIRSAPFKSASATITLLSNVLVAVNPALASISAGKKQKFKAKVSGANNSEVEWSISPAIGTISDNGEYKAPSSVMAGQTVKIIATSRADHYKSGSALLTLK